eukprot:364297-Chlamydomonas_euryale.AAC.9
MPPPPFTSDFQVFSKIQDRLQSAVDARTTRQVEARLKSQMDSYIHTTNTRLGVFCDIIDSVRHRPKSRAGQNRT